MIRSISIGTDTMDNFPLDNLLSRSSIKCAGQYCGRLSNVTIACGPCPWGSRSWTSNADDICQDCLNSPDTQGIFYLGFMAILPILCLLPCLPNDCNDAHDKDCLESRPITCAYKFCKYRHARSWFYGFSLFAIHAFTATVVVLLFPPFGRLDVYACEPRHIADFYAFLLGNGCSYEAVFPYMSLPLAYYLLNAACYIILHLFAWLCTPVSSTANEWAKVAYISLYTYPALCLVTIFFSGLLYYIYSYMLFAFALLYSLYRFPMLFDYCKPTQDESVFPIAHPCLLIATLIRSPRPAYIWTIFISLFCYGYSLSSQNRSPLWVLVFTIVPLMFYVLTLPFTHPFVSFDGDRSLNLACMKPSRAPLLERVRDENPIERC